MVKITACTFEHKNLRVETLPLLLDFLLYLTSLHCHRGNVLTTLNQLLSKKRERDR